MNILVNVFHKGMINFQQILETWENEFIYS